MSIMSSRKRPHHRLEQRNAEYAALVRGVEQGYGSRRLKYLDDSGRLDPGDFLWTREMERTKDMVEETRAFEEQALFRALQQQAPRNDKSEEEEEEEKDAWEVMHRRVLEANMAAKAALRGDKRGGGRVVEEAKDEAAEKKQQSEPLAPSLAPRPAKKSPTATVVVRPVPRRTLASPPLTTPAPPPPLVNYSSSSDDDEPL